MIAGDPTRRKARRPGGTRGHRVAGGSHGGPGPYGARAGRSGRRGPPRRTVDSEGLQRQRLFAAEAQEGLESGGGNTTGEHQWCCTRSPAQPAVSPWGESKPATGESRRRNTAREGELHQHEAAEMQGRKRWLAGPGQPRANSSSRVTTKGRAQRAGCRRSALVVGFEGTRRVQAGRGRTAARTRNRQREGALESASATAEARVDCRSCARPLARFVRDRRAVRSAGSHRDDHSETITDHSRSSRFAAGPFEGDVGSAIEEVGETFSSPGQRR